MNELLPLLAIETSDNICGACVYFDDAKYFSSKIILQHAHSEKLFEAIESVLLQSNISKTELKLIAVSSGPGSFTGLRIGMSAAKGLAQSLSLPLVQVPTFEALSLEISEFLPEKTLFSIANKVGRDEMYFAKFQIMGNNYIFKQELKIVPTNSVDLFCERELVFGNALVKNLDLNLNLRKKSAPHPEYVAKWAAKFGLDKAIRDIDFIEPNYLKDFIVKEKKI
ncbi:MAG: tRNA (adenosine(37)-N6)-threonylcarbamoyltransferase complex dimerization subunit type 1 TsaB [Ignavibacteriaceae bacterium]